MVRLFEQCVYQRSRAYAALIEVPGTIFAWRMSGCCKVCVSVQNGVLACVNQFELVFSLYLVRWLCTIYTAWSTLVICGVCNRVAHKRHTAGSQSVWVIASAFNFKACGSNQRIRCFLIRSNRCSCFGARFFFRSVRNFGVELSDGNRWISSSSFSPMSST